MPKQTNPPDSPLENEEWPFTTDEDLTLFLEMEHQKLKDAPSHMLPAFNALAYIVTDVWRRKESRPPEQGVVFPKWVAEALAQGFLRYFDAAHRGEYISLGKAYGLEGRGQGEQPPIVGERNQTRDIRIVTTLAQRHLEGIKLEAALQEMADVTDLSLARVRHIWEKDGKRATAALKNLRTRKTS